jgi:DnaJ family protein B protein 12
LRPINPACLSCKVVSKAFQILSDSQKRAAFDQSGGDPDSRFAGVPSPGMARGFAGGRQFEGEISPEDLFNMFFGGGMGGQMGGGGFGGGPFGGGPGGEHLRLGAIKPPC